MFIGHHHLITHKKDECNLPYDSVAAASLTRSTETPVIRPMSALTCRSYPAGQARHAIGEVASVPRQRLSDARAVLAYSREVATAPPGANGAPMTVIPFEAATP